MGNPNAVGKKGNGKLGNLPVGGQLRCSFVANLLQYLRAKNCENIMRFDKVTAKTERVQFFCPHSVYKAMNKIKADN